MKASLLLLTLLSTAMIVRFPSNIERRLQTFIEWPAQVEPTRSFHFVNNFDATEGDYDCATSNGNATKCRYPICMGILAFQGRKTLDRTLSTYNTSGLFDLVSEWHILFQKIDSPGRKSWAESIVKQYPVLKPIYLNLNTGLKNGFLTLAGACAMQPYTLILEEDFFVGETADLEGQLENGMFLLQNSIADAVRYRHRVHPGMPNWSYSYYKKMGTVLDSHLISHLMWNSEAEHEISAITVCRSRPKTWCIPSRHGHYTNNPVLYKSDFALNLYSQAPMTEGTDFEVWLQKHWQRQNYTLAWSDGIFTHERLDRTF